MAFNQDGSDAKGLVGLDAPRVRRADAITLMVHHLSLAAMYFEATPDGIAESIAEIDDAMSGYPGNPKNKAAVAWLKVIAAEYEALDQ